MMKFIITLYSNSKKYKNSLSYYGNKINTYINMSGYCEQVLGNDDLRRLIFSFLRKKAQKSCQICHKVCVWDKKVNSFIELKYYPWNMYGDTICMECQQSVTPTCIIN